MKNTALSYYTIIGAMAALLISNVLWELWLAPIKPGGSWLVLKILPLLFTLPGILRRNNYTLQWTSMLVLLYFTEGVVRASSDLNPVSRYLAGLETVFSVILFSAILTYLRPIKLAHKAARKISQQE